jgi:omega-6 fatty acid desaturase (delta-12 desaturase)
MFAVETADPELRPTISARGCPNPDKRLLSIGHDTDTSAPDARVWTQILNRYRQPNQIRGVVELTITALPLAACWAAAWFVYSLGHWWASLLIAVPASGFLVRLFMIQHDCSHGAFFPRKWANDWVGRIIGVLTLTPYDFWRRTHALHHATSGNLDSRGFGDVDTLTVREYFARSRWGRLRYRLYRHPIVLFGLGPGYVFLLRHRLPMGLLRGGWRPWISTQATNAAIGLIVAVLVCLVGVKAFLVVHLPIMFLAATFGVWLFYVQHQFEETFWNERRHWSLHEAALHGASYYDLPRVLRWFSANIGIHHVHHLCSRIPYYRLQSVLRDHPELREVGRLTLLQSFRCVRLVLWDEAQRRLVSFRDARRFV